MNYFVSYYFKTSSGATGYSNCTIKTEKEIATPDDIDAVTWGLEAKYDRAVVILFFKDLPKECDKEV